MINHDKEQLKNRLKDYCDRVLTLRNETGGRSFYNCPFCGSGTGKNRHFSPAFNVYQKNGDWLWFCQSCGKHGDLFHLIALIENLDERSEFPKILQIANDVLGEIVDVDINEHHDPKLKYIPRTEPEAPDDLWQNEGRQFIEECKKNLWQPIGKKAREYLIEERKFNKETLEKFNIGYNPQYISGKALPGITIPSSVGDKIFKINIRTDSGNPKYKSYYGSVGCCPFNADDLQHEIDLLIVEGELDAMTVWQSNFCGVVTFGSASMVPDAVVWRNYLRKPERICICCDNDASGERSAKNIYDEILRLENVRPCDDQHVYIRQLPNDYKDWNDFCVNDGNIQNLLNEFFPLNFLTV